MKKILLFSLVLVFATAGYSQGVKIGLKGGLNFPTVDALGVQDGVQVADKEGSSGYHVGAFVRIKAAKIALQPEILYSFQSIDYTADFGGVNGVADITQNISYLTVPVMLRLYLVAGLNLQAGPQFGFLLNGENQLSAAGITDVSDVEDQLKGTDIGINLGAGWDLPFGLDVHARYTIGVQDVSETNNEAKNSMIQVSIGYALVNLGK